MEESPVPPQPDACSAAQLRSRIRPDRFSTANAGPSKPMIHRTLQGVFFKANNMFTTATCTVARAPADLLALTKAAKKVSDVFLCIGRCSADRTGVAFCGWCIFGFGVRRTSWMHRSARAAVLVRELRDRRGEPDGQEWSLRARRDLHEG